MTGMERWRVHKFGGSSVADAACMERVAPILEDDPRRRVAAVLLACRGVTDVLLALVTAAERQEDGDAGRLEAVRQRHIVMPTRCSELQTPRSTGKSSAAIATTSPGSCRPSGSCASRRPSSATWWLALVRSGRRTVLVIWKEGMAHLMHTEPAFAERFISYMVTR